jgi:hypothetical protein
MGNPARSLNQLVSWTQVLPALGVQVPMGLLPVTAPCPLCQSTTLDVFGDRVVGGQWARCNQCEFAGDLIELVSRAWKLDIPSALVRLSNLDLLSEPLPQDNVDGYLRDHIRARQRFNEFWRQAQLRPVLQTPPGLPKLLRHFGLWEQANNMSWLQRGGSVVGTADFHQVQELFAPLAYAQQPRVNHNGKTSVRRGAGPGKYRLFRGGGWDEVLAMPFFDLPGRICGFMFLGRDIDPEAGDVIYKPANFQPSAMRYHEGGLAMWGGMEQKPHHILGDVLFVVADPLVALLLQGQSFRDSFVPLPVVASYFDARVKTDAALAHLPSRKLVFWGKNPCILKQAKVADALVSCYPISPKEIQRNLCHHESVMWLRLILKAAQPWQVVLRQQLRNCDARTGEAILREMEFTPDEVRRCATTSDTELRKRLEGFDCLRLSSRKVQVRGKTVIESEAGWSLEHTGEVICSAAIRIEEVLQSSDDTRYYRGMARLGGAEHPFTVPAADVERRGLLPEIRDFLVKQDAGFLQYQHTWVKDSAHIAISLGEAKCRSAVDHIGWHPKERRFVFPRFSITSVGEVCSGGAPLLVDHPPAANLREPLFRPFMPEELDALCADRPEVSVFWALGASILHNLLAPAANREPAGILLAGQGAQVIGPILAKAMGCVELNLRRPMRGQSVLEQINTACGRHDWPTVVSGPLVRPTQVTAEWAEASGPKNAIFSPNPYAALSLGTNVGFNVISGHEPAAPLDALRQAAAHLVPAYVADVCERKLWLGLRDVRMRDILPDLADWFQRVGGDAAAVRGAENVLYVGGHQPWRLFVELVFRLCAAGHLDLARDGFQSRRPAVPTIVHRLASDTMPPAYVVPARSLNRLLGRLGAPAINLSKIQESLKDTPGFFGANETGWMFEEAWWQDRYHECCRREGEAEADCVMPRTMATL